MGLTDRLKAAAIGLFTGMSPNQAYGMFTGILPGSTGVPPKRGTKELLDSYNTMPWIRAAVNKVSRGVASTPWQLFVVRNKRGEPMKMQSLQKANRDIRRALMHT